MQRTVRVDDADGPPSSLFRGTTGQICNMHLAARQAQAGAPVVGVGDHAVAVEHARDVLLGPVPRGQLRPQQAQRSSMQRLSVQRVLPGCQQRQHGPGCVHDMAGPLQLRIHLSAWQPVNPAVVTELAASTVR